MSCVAPSPGCPDARPGADQVLQCALARLAASNRRLDGRDPSPVEQPISAPVTHLLPAPETDEAFHAVDRATDYAAALRVIAERVAIDASATPVRFEDGSLPVFSLAGRVVKLYPPSCEGSYQNERAVLEHVEGALPIMTPRVEAASALEQWHYIVMSRVPGRPLRACLHEVPSRERARLFSGLGEAIGRLHALATETLPSTDWATMVQRQRAGCVARHRRLGLDEAWLARIDPFLDAILPDLPVGGPYGLLHTEVMQEHVFVEKRAGRFEPSGLIDFEPSRVGPPGYELASVGLFLSEGDRVLFRAFLDGLGLARADGGTALARRCMAWALLHRYANLHWWLRRLPARSARRSIDDLAGEWFDDGR